MTKQSPREQVGLADLRKARCVTQVQLAERLGISQATLSEMEQPGNNPRLRSVLEIVAALGGRAEMQVAFDDGEHYRLSPPLERP